MRAVLGHLTPEGCSSIRQMAKMALEQCQTKFYRNLSKKNNHSMTVLNMKFPIGLATSREYEVSNSKNISY